MSEILVRFQTLTWAERKALAEALVALGGAAFVVAMVPFRQVATRLGRMGDLVEPTCSPDGAIARTRWAIEACARRVPWRAKCFEQGLAAHWMLRRRGIPATLHYGLAKVGGGGLSAHVWVCAGSSEVVGCENSSEFVEVCRFPSPSA